MEIEFNGKVVEAYPLHWPSGTPRTSRRCSSNFRGHTFASARDLLQEEVRLLRGKNLIISSNIPLKQNGFPYANFKSPEDPGIAVYFLLDGDPVCIPCDKWDTPSDNMKAIAKTISNMRGIERWGANNVLKRMFSGFKALPHQDQWWDFLGVDPATVTEDELRRIRNKKAHQLHPDKLGNSEFEKTLAQLNAYVAEGIEAVRRRK